jgi:hypothetical protein
MGMLLKTGSMSAIGGSGGSDTGLIDLSAVGDEISQQQKRAIEGANAKALADSRAAVLSAQATHEQDVVNDQSLSSAEDTRKKQLAILDGSNALIEKARVAMALSDSRDPLDRIKLYALQQTDPAYTREGNTSRLAYLQTAADAMGGIELLKQQGFQDQSTAIKNKLSVALEPDNQMLAQMQIQIDLGQRKIDAASNAAASKLDLMTKTDNMQVSALSNLTPEQVAAAEQQAINSPDGAANIGGVTISLAKITDRKQQLADRDWLSYSRDLQMQTASVQRMGPEEVDAAIQEAANSKSRSATVNGVSLSMAQLNERRVQLQSQDAQEGQNIVSLATQSETMRRMTDEKMLKTYTAPELNAIILNGGEDPTRPGTKFDLDQVTATRDLLIDAKTKKIGMDSAVSQITDPSSTIVEFDNYLKSVDSSTTPDSPLAATVKSQRDMFRFGSSLLDSKDPMEVSAGLSMIQAVKANVETAIDGEAKRLSAGDKDRELAYQYKLRGQPIPAETVATAIDKRVQKGLPIGEWLAPQNASAYKSAYSTALTDIRMKQPMLSNQEQASLASEQAMQTIMPSISAGVTEQLLSMQMAMPDSPFKGSKVTPSTLLSMYKEADDQGTKNYQRNTGLTDEEMMKRITGEVADPALAASQAAAFYISLEKLQPGLGAKYVDWWNSPSRTQMVATYSQAASKNAANGKFSDLSQFSMVAPTLQDQMSQYASSMTDGQRQVYSKELAAQHQDYVMFGGNPASKQAFLLEQDKSLTDIEKQSAMTLIIGPLIKQAQADKMNAEQTNTFIETNLRTQKFDDPTMTNLQKKILASRGPALKVIDDFAKTQPPPTTNIIIPFTSLNVQVPNPLQMFGSGIEPQVSGLSWYNDWRKSQQGN